MNGSTLEITWDFNQPFIIGAPAASEEVFAKYDCAINGIGFMIDWNDDQLQGPNTIPLYRYGGQLDAGVRPGEATLSREDLWRRTISSLHHGAGQRWADRKDSDEFRFRTSKGIDPWTPDRVTLLSDVNQIVSSATIGEMVGFFELLGNTVDLHYSSNGVWTHTSMTASADTVSSTGAVGGLPGNLTASAYNALAGGHAAAYGTIYTTPSCSVYKYSGGSASSFAVLTSSGPANCIAVAHGRVIVGVVNKLYDVTAGGTFGAATATLSGGDRIWQSFTAGTKVIYGAGIDLTGVDSSRIYSISYDQTTAALGAPTVAAEIPIGETIQTIYGHLGFLFVGTDKGFRMCREASDASLTVGPLVPIAGGVTSFTSISGFVYFTWSNFDSTSSGLGRIDISVFTDEDLVPAYASDLMGPVAGTARSVVALNNLNPAVNAHRPWFSITGAGGGIFVEHATDYVASGTLDTGLIGFDLSEQKDLTAIDLRTEPLAGTIEVKVSPDEGVFTSVDIDSAAGSAGMYMPARHVGASRHELRLVFTRGSATTAPVLTGVTMLAYPAVQRGEVWTLPLIVQDDIVDRLGYPMPVDFWTQVFAIRNLTIPGTAPVTVQIGSQSFQAHISDYQTSPFKMNEYGRLQATMRVQFKNMDRQVAA